MAASPKISVITACYNHGKYIHEMIDSVLNQTFQDFEIIIVNDGSTDNTREILDAIKNEKTRIIYTENNGPSHARNLAIQNASAELILSLDADDKIAPDLLAKAYDAFCENPDAGIIFAKCRYFGVRLGESKYRPFDLKNMLLENRIEPTAFFRKEDWQKTGGYSDLFYYDLEDWDFWLSILELKRQIIKIPDSHVFYRKYSRMAQCRSGLRKCDPEKYYYSLNLIFSRHKNIYSLFPDIYRKFSRYNKIQDQENRASRFFRILFFHLKQKLAYQIR